MQSEKAYYCRIAGFFNAGRPVATPAGPANLVLKEETPWYQKSSLNLYRHTAGRSCMATGFTAIFSSDFYNWSIYLLFISRV